MNEPVRIGAHDNDRKGDIRVGGEQAPGIRVFGSGGESGSSRRRVSLVLALRMAFGGCAFQLMLLVGLIVLVLTDIEGQGFRFSDTFDSFNYDSKVEGHVLNVELEETTIFGRDIYSVSYSFKLPNSTDPEPELDVGYVDDIAPAAGSVIPVEYRSDATYMSRIVGGYINPHPLSSIPVENAWYFLTGLVLVFVVSMPGRRAVKTLRKGVMTWAEQKEVTFVAMDPTGKGSFRKVFYSFSDADGNEHSKWVLLKLSEMTPEIERVRCFYLPEHPDKPVFLDADLKAQYNEETNRVVETGSPKGVMLQVLFVPMLYVLYVAVFISNWM